MSLWTVEPRDTLIVRDARPILEGSPPMRSLDFPWPSSLAGLVRTRVGLDDRGQFTLTVDQARAVEVAGPLLWSVNKRELLAPAPRDCVWFRKDGATARARLRLAPAALLEGGVTDLAASHPHLKHLTLPGGGTKDKPASGPAFWRWSELEKWLVAPDDRLEDAEGNFGLAPLEHERRVHVKIDGDALTADEGNLFESDGLRFIQGADRERLALAVRCEDRRLTGGVVPLGGERRMSVLTASDEAWPAPPAGLAERIEATRRARVVVLTPALFASGALPEDGGALGAGVAVTAAAVGRPEAISGWDFAAGGAKPVRRAAPAGSVYWVRFGEGVNVRRWLDQTWLKCVSDDAQDRRDGFGLAVVGVA